MDFNAESPRTRRSLLAAAVAAVGAAVATAVGQPLAVRAADGEPFVLGSENSALTATGLTGSVPSTSGDVLHVVNQGTSGSAIAAYAVHSGGIGVRAEGSHGVVGTSFATSGAGVLGEDATGSVLGRGVMGSSSNGWGVYAATSNGQALRVDGRATFNRAGRVTIAYPERSATIVVPGGLKSGTSFPERPSLGLAVAQSDLPGVFVQATTLDVAAGTLTIWLNKAPGGKRQPASIDVGWFVVN